ncbi:MAG: endonuclease/exonuclease/phosphatase family protein [Bacteriovoracaceae bacterium]
MKMTALIFLVLALLLVGFLAWMPWPWSLSPHKSEAPVIVVEPKVDIETLEESPSVIKVLTWNLGFLYGKGSEGPGYLPRTKEFYEERLQGLVNQIREWSPDIICFQEIDFDSHRSGGINQAEYVAIHAGYPFLAEGVSWEANYIPFPYWPPSRNFGHMRSGGAILSRFPIKSHELEVLEKPKSNPWWYNLFYLHRFFQKVVIDIGGKDYTFINLHLEAFDKEDRAGQAKLLVQRLKNEHIDFAAGDYNMVPDSAAKKRKFPESEDDYDNDQTFGVMKNSGLDEVIPEEIYGKDEQRFFTFPAWAPNRRLDYIFFKKGLKMMRAEVLPSALSDHLPLRASFQLSGPKFNPYQQ